MTSPKAVIVVFASQKGGVGKSTLARALAIVGARAGLNVSIADLDPQQATIAEWMRMRVESKIAQKIIVEGYESVKDAALEAFNCDLLILDMPARANRETLEAARHAHLVVQPSAGSLDDLKPAVLLFHELKQAGIPVNRMTMVLTRILSRNEEIAARTYVKQAGYAVLSGAVREHAVYRDAQNRGRAVNETATEELNVEVDDVMTELMARAVEAAKGPVVGFGATRKDRGGAA